MKTKYNGYTCYKCKKVFVGADKIPACSNMKLGFDQCADCFNKRVEE